MNNIIVFFPLGAGGNFVRNLITLDTRYEFLDDSEFYKDYPTTLSRYVFLQDYYSRAVDSGTWLEREWSTRTALHQRYFENNNIAYWNPRARVVYLIHGDGIEMQSILEDRRLSNFDKSSIALGNDSEAITETGLKSCTHVFITPSDIDLITQIYISKNAKLNQFAGNVAAAYEHNRLLQATLDEYRAACPIHINIESESLFRSADTLCKLMSLLDVQVPTEMIRKLHSLWLQSTKQLYYNTYIETLPL